MTSDQGVNLKVTATLIGFGLTVVINAITAIWLVATVTTKLTLGLQAVQMTTGKLENTLSAVVASNQDVRERVRVIEDRETRYPYPPGTTRRPR